MYACMFIYQSSYNFKGGARLKQSDKSLDQFSKACESLNLQTISSILLHYIHSES